MTLSEDLKPQQLKTGRGTAQTTHIQMQNKQTKNTNIYILSLKYTSELQKAYGA